ncbi:hypothetical protein F0562_005892 [Nyssa sinensis]|uniref:F-box associated domain-containing protein n=1 Tax=Nyssa sinensis TaxID=561372 RepID=A0A5J5ALR0_9ASTE|nr:hypothetical protein F0562_005892 [Nyssa sinensis]
MEMSCQSNGNSSNISQPCDIGETSYQPESNVAYASPAFVGGWMTTRKSKRFPNSGMRMRYGCFMIYGFDYDDSNDDFKVVGIYCGIGNVGSYETEVNIYTMRIDSWRRIQDFPCGIPLDDSDQQDLSGWPLLYLLKAQMQKCDKVSHSAIEMSCQSNGNSSNISQPCDIGGTSYQSKSNVAYASPAFVGGWMDVCRMSKGRCVALTFKKLYEGLSTGFLPKELTMYPIVNGTLINPMPLKYFKQVPDHVSSGSQYLTSGTSGINGTTNYFMGSGRRGDDRGCGIYCVIGNVGSYETKVKIYTMRIDSWRRIQDFSYGIPLDDSGKYANGALYWAISSNAGSSYS